MTRRDKEALRQRLPISLGLMALGSLLLCFLYGHLHKETAWLLRATFSLATIGSILCGLLFLFYQHHAFWMSYGGLFLLFVGYSIPNGTLKILKIAYVVFLLVPVVLFDLWDRGFFKKQAPPIPPLPADTIFVRLRSNGVCCRLFIQDGTLLAQHLSADLKPLETQIIFPKNSKLQFSEVYNEWLDEVEQIVTIQAKENTYTLQAEPPTSYDVLKAFLQCYYDPR